MHKKIKLAIQILSFSFIIQSCSFDDDTINYEEQLVVFASINAGFPVYDTVFVSRTAEVNELVVSAGFKNLALDLKIGRQARINLEEILIARPDFILTPEASTKFPSLAQSMLLHPVFETTRAKNYRWKHLEVPEWAWLCGGLQNIYALDLLKKARLKFSGRVDQHD